MRLSLPLLFFCGALFAENLLPDASFELGGSDYAKRRFIRDLSDVRQHRYLAPVRDENDPVHGKVSLRFENPFGQMTGLRTPDFHLQDGVPYTFSFYAKSSRPVKVRAMLFSVIPDDDNFYKGLWDNGNYRFFTLTTEWKRYSISFTPKKNFHWYFADLLWGEGSDATVWLDAFMISPGKTVPPFAPKSPVEFALDSSKHCRIDGDDPLSCVLSAVNYGKQNAETEIRLCEYDDYRGRKLGEQSLKLTVPAGQTVRKKLTVDQKKYGIYSLRGEARFGGKTERIWPYLYAVTGKYVPGKVEPERDFLLGCEEGFGFEYPDINGGRPLFHLKEADLAEYERLVRNRGVRLHRLGNGTLRAFRWDAVQPEDGKFDFRMSDWIVNKVLKEKDFVLGVLGNNFLERNLPRWVIERGRRLEKTKVAGAVAILPDLGDWRRYVAETVRHFKGRVHCWEILNEANLTTPPEEYVKYLKIAFEERRKIDPSIKVVAPNVTGDHGGVMADFLERFGKAGGFQYTDIVSFHPYSSREEDSPSPSRTAIASIRAVMEKYRGNLPLWNTELYYLYDNPPHSLDAGKGRACHFIRRMLLDLGEGIRQETLLPDSFFFRQDRNPKYGYIVCRVVRRWIPSEHYVAGNAFARFMEGCVPVQRMETPRGVSLYVYRRKDGTPVAALWNFSKKLKFDIVFDRMEKMEFFDLFGNPIQPEKPFRIPADPVYIRGKESVDALIRALKNSRIAAETGFEITRAGYFVRNGKAALALEFRSALPEKQNLRVRLLSAPEARPAAPGSSALSLDAGKTAVILLPLAVKEETRLKGGTVRVMVYDGKTTRTITLPVEPVSLLRKDERAILNSADRLTFGKAESFDPRRSSMEFSASGNSECFRLFFRVRDAKRGSFSESEPWNMDGLELFFDRKPLVNMERREYTADVFRLFLCPAAGGKKAFLKGQGNVNEKELKWKILDTADGYTAELSIPWKTLKLVPGSPVRFDVALDNCEDGKRISQLTWSGSSRNHLYRSGFGIWVP